MKRQRASKRGRASKREREGGVALFMVLASIALLSVLVSEFVYVVSVNQRMAFDGIDQLKAHYLAKSAYKLSLLRLTGYKQIQAFVNQQGMGALVPKQLLNQIWSFPFSYPIPEIPGMSMIQKDSIAKFQKESTLEGKYTSSIESESAKFNLNSIVIKPPLPAGSPTPVPTTTPSDSDWSTPPTSPPSASPTATSGAYDVEGARKNLGEFVSTLISNKMKADESFQEEYRDLNVNDLVDGMIAWADAQYSSQNNRLDRNYPWKQAPYYSLSELHFLPGMDDKLFEIIAPALTVNSTSAINLNTMREPMLHALIPLMTAEELEKFFTDRLEKPFDNAEGFYKWIQDNVTAYRSNPEEVKKTREALEKRGIQFQTDETEFYVKVIASVNQSTQTLEAWVSLNGSSSKAAPTPSAGNNPAPQASPTAASSSGDSGIQVRFMRFL